MKIKPLELVYLFCLFSSCSFDTADPKSGNQKVDSIQNRTNQTASNKSLLKLSKNRPLLTSPNSTKNVLSSKKIVSDKKQVTNNSNYLTLLNKAKKDSFKNLIIEKKSIRYYETKLLDSSGIKNPKYVSQINSIYLARTAKIHNHILNSEKKNDSLNLYLESLYLKVLQTDSLNINAIKKLTDIWYNLANSLTDTSLVAKKKQKDKQEAEDLIKKAVPYAIKLASLKPLDRFTLILAAGIYSILDDKEAFYNELIGIHDTIHFYSLSAEYYNFLQYEDSLYTKTSLSADEKKVKMIGYCDSIIAIVKHRPKFNSDTLKNTDDSQNLLQVLNEKILELDSLNIKSNSAMTLMYYKKFKSLLNYYKHANKSNFVKFILKKMILIDFEKYIKYYLNYGKSIDKKVKISFKKDGLISILTEEEISNYKKQLGDFMEILE